MAAKKSAAFDFVVSYLKKNPKAAYADVQAAAKKKNYKIFPIVYGRAKALLGLVKTSPRGSKKKTKAKRATTKKVGRRAASASSGGAMSSLQNVIDAMKTNEAERDRYRRALEQIQDILDRALS